MTAKVTVPVFISYHASDLEIAKELSTSLKKLSREFTVFLDKYSIAPGERFEPKIADEIKKAEWFLIVCTGFPRRDADMMWSFFEAGQFRATLREPLAPEANKRIVCVFDDEPPQILSMFQGVKVCGQQRSGAKIDLTTLLPKNNNQLEDSAIYDLLERMLKNEPEVFLRDTTELSTREMLREELFKLINLFASARPTDVLIEKSLQPRISFELLPSQKLTPEIIVKGYDQSLRLLFSLEPDETTWGKIIETCEASGKGKPTWLSDIEQAAADILDDRTPANYGNKCILRSVIYRVIVSRYEVYKDSRRAIYIGFLPVSTQPFDMTKTSSTLLSSLILSIRFREKIIPMATGLRAAKKDQSGTLQGLLQEFYRLLVAVEMEARQFGLALDSDIPGDEAPLTLVVKNRERRTVIQTSIDDWTVDRRLIEDMFVTKPIVFHSGEQANQCAQQIIEILEKITDVNATFIEMVTAELLDQIRERDRRSSKKTTRKKNSPRSRKARDESEMSP